MDFYLPIAEMSVNLFLLLAIGAGVGFLSGVFGVGGGFLMTPLLIFTGIPAPVAVATGAVQVLATSVSGALTQLRRGGVDVRMGLVLVAGGSLGAILGVLLFRWLSRLGQIETFVLVAYVFFLGTVGGIMLVESTRAILVRRRSPTVTPRHRQHGWLQRLPLKVRFPSSRLYISALLPFATGAFIGVLTAFMGVGGGFILIPAMVYLIGMPTGVVVGTSLFQLAFVSGVSTLLHAVTNQTVDIVLGLLLIGGGVVGTQFGSRVGSRLRGEQLRVLLAIIVLAVCGRLAVDLVATPADPYSISVQ